MVVKTKELVGTVHSGQWSVFCAEAGRPGCDGKPSMEPLCDRNAKLSAKHTVHGDKAQEQGVEFVFINLHYLIVVSLLLWLLRRQVS